MAHMAAEIPSEKEVVHPVFLPADNKALERLAQAEGPALTIYLAPHRGGAGGRPATMRLRAMLHEIEAVCDIDGMSRADRDALLVAVAGLLADPKLSSGSGETLVIFRSPRIFEIHGVPGDLPDSFALGSRFVVLPLMERLRATRTFLMLTLTRKRARLLRVRGAAAEEVPMPKGVVADFDEAMGFDTPDHRLANASSAGPGTGAMGAVQFGTGSAREKRMKHFHDFCRQLDRGLRPLLDTEAAPLVLAGVESELSIYREAGTYRETVSPGIEMSPDGGASDAELAALARPVVSAWLTEAERRALALLAQSRATVEVHQILHLAHEGRVRALFLLEGQRQLGDARRIAGDTPRAGEFIAREEDLVNAAAVETLRHSGDVWVVPAQAMPVKSGVAAVVRF